MTITRLRPRKPGPLLDRKAFRLAEETYVDRFLARLRALKGIRHPGDGRVYDASERNRRLKHLDAGTRKLKETIRQNVPKNLQALYEEMPKNPVMLAEFTHREFLRSSRVRIVAAAAAVSPVEELIRDGKTRSAATAADLEFLKQHLIRRPDVFHFIGVFSATGWNPACRSILTGGNFLIALTDRHMDAWRTFCPPDNRWGPAAELFDPTTAEEKREAVHQLVSRCTAELLMDEMTETFVIEELGYPLPIVREAFVSIAAKDPFLRYDATGKPHRLIRIYG